jgi:prepilin-type N-terminal cleavage/methylation domain-containing protein
MIFEGTRVVGSTITLRPTALHLAPAAPDAAFTLTELMVVVVILGVLGAVATPYLARDRKASLGKEFAGALARDFQRVHIQALSERLSIRAFIFRDRVEMRSWVAGATPGAAPRAPLTTDPVLRTLATPNGVDVYDVLTTTTPAPTTAVLTTTTPVSIDFTSPGQAQFVGQATLAPAFLFVKNSQVQPSHPDAMLRVDIRALTGYVALHAGW